MPRKSITELTAQADATLPDNATQLITPAAVRNMIKDFLNTMRPAYAAATITTPVVKALTTTDSALALETTISNSPADFTINLPTGLVTQAAHGTVRVNFTVDVQYPNNSITTFTLYADGVATPWAISNTSTSATDLQSYALSAINYSSALTPTYQIRVKSNGSNSVTLSNGALVVENVPVNVFT